MKKWLFSLFALFSLGYALFALAIWRINDGFQIKKIQSDVSNSPQWEVANPPIYSIQSLLSQNFYYVGKGSQCYVFESEDKAYVLKFIRHSRYRLPYMTRYIRTPSFLVAIQNQKKIAKDKKLKKLLTSCKLAYEELHEETGLVYLHLNKTHDLNSSVTLYDKLKRPYPIDIDNYMFLIQVRAEQIFPYLSHLLEKGRKEEAKEAIADLVALMTRRLKKDIVDHDPVIHKNAGFRAGHALFLDVGGFSHHSISHPISYELDQMTAHLHAWLNAHDEELGAYLKTLVKNM